MKKAIILFLAVILFTFFRSFLILLSPFVLFFLAYLFKLKLTDKALLSIVLLLISFLVNTFFFKTYVINNIVSILLLYCPLIVLLIKPKYSYFTFEEWMKISSIVLIVVDVTGLLNFFYVLFSKSWLLDDSFSGLYGRSGLSMHTLSIVNFIYCVYYLNTKNYKRFFVFFVSGFMCFYGLGLLLFLASLGLVLLKKVKMQYLKFLILTPIIVYVGALITIQINPHVFTYMHKNIDEAVNSLINNIPYESEMNDVRNFETVKTPRKILAFQGAYKLVKEPKTFFLGVSPGTYNSRTSFLLNGEYTKNPLFEKIKIRPQFAEKDIYPLWNKEINFQYNDGTRNQPFSSFVSLFVEYGVINSLLICYLLYLLFRRVLSYNPEKKFFIRFLFVFSFFNILFENYLEYPEYMILLIIIIKTLETNTKKRDELNKIKI